MIIEVIGTTLNDVKEAELYGANRVELCQSMSEDGLTPSYGLIKSAVESVNIPINVMVRPHDDSFVYDANDLKVMCEDIRMIKKIGANGIVIGPLTKEGTIDEAALQALLHEANGLEVTFHRAFDFVKDQQEALATILKYKQVTTILTAGGNGAATEFASNLAELVEQTKDTHLTIMPGHGLRVDDLAEFYQVVKPNALHFGTGVRVGHTFANGMSEEKLRQIRGLLM
ncbi:copper homeostasis protein CutC [Neobacillus mesonae]|uniref:copper homeostasis protein CutC n=1 Tax=Neobacillus mesonae TaxID=1193713 RepID=UPI002E20BFD5|nr:copper homeostasis protein CutC [Neobacillus mesonae]MED4203296.1 copper homeostasis protein CutC [Neobacillus mesonae]